MKQIICLSNLPWSTTPGRTQQLISRLKDTQVLYFSPAQGRHDRTYKERGRKVRSNVTTYTLPPVPAFSSEGFAPLFRWRQRKLARFIMDKAARHRFRSPLLWVSNPAHIHLLDHLDYTGLVYDCDRVWDDLPPVWEGGLAHAADIVFCASDVLAEQLSPCSSNIAVVENGVNYPLFAEDDGTPPAEHLSDVTGPVFGWAGTVRSDLDLSPLLYAARLHPEWTFLLLGPRTGNPLLSRLRGQRNVVLANACPMAEVPDWLRRCDVLVDFLRDSRIDGGVVPTRLYEYLCTGKPVVAMLWPDQAERFAEVVYGAQDEQEFAELCEKALLEKPGSQTLARRGLAQEAAWPNRVAQVSQILTTAGLL